MNRMLIFSMTEMEVKSTKTKVEHRNYCSFFKYNHADVRFGNKKTKPPQIVIKAGYYERLAKSRGSCRLNEIKSTKMYADISSFKMLKRSWSFAI